MQKTFQFNSILSPEQINFYSSNGYLHFKNFVSKEETKIFIEEVDRVTQKLIAEKITRVNGIPLKFGTGANGNKIIQRLAFASQHSNVLREFLRDSRFTALFTLLGNYEGRIGEQEKDGLVVNHYENTEHSNFKQLGWHTDSPRDLFLGSRIMPMLNVGLHLDDHPKENGGLRVLPGTHKQNLFSLFFRKKYFIDNNPDPNEEGFDIEAGDLTIHHGNLWHRVQQSIHTGDKSRRRVMYIPIITGQYQYKHAASKTPFYHRIGQLQIPKFKLQS
jgi:phytanoyl-CoA hydroxylase